MTAGPRRWLRVLAWNAGLLLVGLLIVEAVFGSWFRSPQLWSLSIYRNVDWRLDVSDKYPRAEPVRYIRDYYGLRGTFGEPENADLMTLGGSTTDERFVDQGATWPDVLGACLREKGYEADVANAGITGQSTRGNIRNFEIWLNHIDGLAPKLVVVYAGINELYVESDAQSKMDDVRTFTEAVTPHDPWKSLRKWARMNSVLHGLYRVVKGNIKAWRSGVAIAPKAEFFGAGHEAGKPRMQDETEARYRKLADRTIVIGSDEYEKRVSEARQAYATQTAALGRRLDRLTREIKAFGAVPAYVTNPWGIIRIEDGVVSGALDLFFKQNAYLDVVRAHCRAERLKCVDVAMQMKVEPGDFFDSAHTTEKGSAKIGRLICEGLIRAGDLPLKRRR